MMTDAKKPSGESGPYSLNMSNRSEVAAEDDIIFTKTIGTSAAGKCSRFIKGVSNAASPSNAPEALNTPVATKRPINVGRIPATTRNPRAAPSVK